MIKKIFFTFVLFFAIQTYLGAAKNYPFSHIIKGKEVYAVSNKDNQNTYITPDPTSQPSVTLTPTTNPQPTPQAPTPEPTKQKEVPKEHTSSSDESQDASPKKEEDNKKTPPLISSVSDNAPPTEPQLITHTLSGLLSRVINPPHEFDYTGSLNNFYNTPKMSSQETAFLLVLSAMMSTTGLSLLIFPYMNQDYWNEKKQFNLIDSFNYEV